MIMTQDEKYREMIKILARNCDTIDEYLLDKWNAFYIDLMSNGNEYDIYSEMVYTTLLEKFDIGKIVPTLDSYDKYLYKMYMFCDKVYK